jgi:hypothetical protein
VHSCTLPWQPNHFRTVSSGKYWSILCPIALLKEHLWGHRFQSEDNVETAVKWWLSNKYTDSCQQGIEKPVPQYDASVFAETISKSSGITVELPYIFHIRDCNKNTSNCMYVEWCINVILWSTYPWINIQRSCWYFYTK